jgi:FkbM family methyltransferase
MSALLKPLKDLRYRLFYGAVIHRGFALQTLCAPGSICPWTICPVGLNAKSIIYSAGVGSDISFEHELVKNFACQVILLDPSPTGLRTMSLSENKIPEFRHFPLALAAHNGTLNMAPPLDPQGDSWFARKDITEKHEVRCTDLHSLMAQNGHQHIDFLKLDIEGCEYEVIDDLLKRRLPIRQICVEYHHGIVPGITRGQTIRSMLKLIARGYKLLCQEGANHTFLRSLPD